MKRILLFYLFVCSSVCFSQTIISGGNVSGNWNLEGAPYIITGNILVPNGETLSIDPGVRVEFEGHYKLFCNGSILAIGEESQNIVFTTTDANVDGWLGIRYEDTPSSNETSKFEYCIIEKGKTNQFSVDTQGGAFFIKNFSKVEIRKSILRYNHAQSGAGAIYLENSNVIIEQNNIYDNTSVNGYSGIEARDSDDLSILENTFNNCTNGFYNSTANISNNTFDNSPIYGFVECDLFIEGNIFENINNDDNENVGGISFINSKGTIVNNIFRNNNVGLSNIRIDGYNNTAPLSYLINNLFYSNQSTYNAGVIRLKNNHSYLYNNTIVDNNTFAVYCEENSDPTIINSIIYGNSRDGQVLSIYLSHNESDPVIKYSDVQNGTNGIDSNGNPYTGEYLNNLDIEPLFANQNNSDYSLNSNSSLINAGDPTFNNTTIPYNDLAGNSRFIENIIDIGAYEAQLLNLNEYGEKGTISFYPNPVSDNIIFAKTINSISIYNLAGEKVFYSNERMKKFSVSHLSSGIYIMNVTTSQGQFTKKIIKM